MDEDLSENNMSAWFCWRCLRRVFCQFCNLSTHCPCLSVPVTEYESSPGWMALDFVLHNHPSRNQPQVKDSGRGADCNKTRVLSKSICAARHGNDCRCVSIRHQVTEEEEIRGIKY